MSELIITNIITAIATISAATIGSYFMYKSNSDKKDYNKLVKNSFKYLQELKLFYELEQIYIEKVEELTQKSGVTIKKDMRKKLDGKLTMTSNEAEKILKANRYQGLFND